MIRPPSRGPALAGDRPRLSLRWLRRGGLIVSALVLATTLTGAWMDHAAELGRAFWTDRDEALRETEALAGAVDGWSALDRLRWHLFRADLILDVRGNEAYREALEHARDSLQGAVEASPDPHLRGMWDALRAADLAAKSMHRDAVALFDEGAARLRGVGPPARADLADTLQMMLISLIVLDDGQRLLENHRESRRLYADAGDAISLAALDASTTYLIWPTPEEKVLAERRLIDAAEFFRREDLPLGIIFATHELLFHSELSLEEIENVLRELEPLMERHGSTQDRINELNIRIHAHNARKDHEHVAALLEELLVLTEASQDREQKLWYTMALANVSLRLGTEEALARAEELCQWGLEEAAAQGDAYSEVRARLGLCEIALRRGEPAARVRDLEESLAWLRANDQVYGSYLLESLRLASRFWHSLGDADRALAALEEAYERKEADRGEAFLEQLALTTAKFRNELQENELQLIQMQRQLAQSQLAEKEQALAIAEARRQRAVLARNSSLLAGALALVLAFWILFLYRQRRLAQGQVEALNDSLKREKETLADALRDGEEAHADLLEANRRLKELDEQRRELLGMAAHDLRNPLGAIQSSLEMLAEDLEEAPTALRDRTRDYLELAREGSGLLAELIEKIIQAHREEKRLGQLHPRDTPLGPLLRQMIELNRTAAARKRMEIELRGELDLAVRADPLVLGSAVDNLLSNAVKYAPPGTRIEVEVSPDLAAEGHEVVVIHVRDEGPGIPAEEFGQLFKPFAKLSNRPTGGEPSSGLGLASVARSMEAMEGRVAVRNRPEGGACFSLFLPRVAREV
jgi:signal transduction histidine kinase